MNTGVPPTEKETTRASLKLIYHISRELASALDLHIVLEHVLQLSLESVGGISGSIIVLGDEGNPIDSAIIHSGQVHDYTTEGLRATIEKGLAGWVLQNCQSVLIPDTSLDERWTKRPDDAPDRTGAKSTVSAPLLARQKLVGVITLVHPKPNVFNEEQRALVQAIADQAGIAVLNARLYTESQNRARAMDALAKSSIAITTALGTEDILQRLLEQIHQALQVEAVSLALVSTSQNNLLFKAATGPVSQSIIGMRAKLGEGIAGWVAKKGNSIVVPSAREHPHFRNDTDRRTGFETRAIICTPIFSNGRIIGILEALNPVGGSFNSDALLLLRGFSSLTGAVIKHGRLIENLHTARKSFQELFEDSIDPIVITDWKGNIIESNRRAASASLTPKEKLQTMTIHQLHEINLEKVGDPNFTHLSAHKTISYESILNPKPEVEIPIEVHVRRIVLDNQECLQWILRDITERKKLDTLRDDLISMIYHDLRSPLANVLYSLEALNTLLPETDDSINTLIDVATRSTERIQRLTTSLLDVKRFEAGQSVINRSPADISELFGDVIHTIHPLAKGKKQEVLTELEPDLPAIFIDGDMIRRVAINLLENAVKYAPPDGQITFGVKQIDEGVQFWVQDNGPGILPEKRDTIFDKFARLHAGGGGFGLGLAFCRLAVNGHGGRIWVESEPGEGSRFIFTLPLDTTENGV